MAGKERNGLLDNLGVRPDGGTHVFTREQLNGTGDGVPRIKGGASVREDMLGGVTPGCVHFTDPVTGELARDGDGIPACSAR